MCRLSQALRILSLDGRSGTDRRTFFARRNSYISDGQNFVEQSVRQDGQNFVGRREYEFAP